MCNGNDIEDETQFMFFCNQYTDLWEYLYEKIHFELVIPDTETISIVMSSDYVKHTAEYLYKVYYKRRSLMNN